MEMLLQADALTRMREGGGSAVCTCSAQGRGEASTPCNRGLVRLATLTNLANYYRQRGLLNAAREYMTRAVRLVLRARPQDLALRSLAHARSSTEWGGPEGSEREDRGERHRSGGGGGWRGVRVCGVVGQVGCGAASRLNQGVLLTSMRNYEEGPRCCAAALSRLQEEWALSRHSLYDPIHRSLLSLFKAPPEVPEQGGGLT